jgi:uncharacterized membrane protein
VDKSDWKELGYYFIPLAIMAAGVLMLIFGWSFDYASTGKYSHAQEEHHITGMSMIFFGALCMVIVYVKRFFRGD